MSFGQAISTCFSKYATFAGRARRREYWFFALFYLIVLVVAVAVDAALKTQWITGLVVLALLLPNLAVTVRRLHDTGRSGWWFFIGFVPLVGGIVLLVFALLDSEPGENKWGLSPKGAQQGYAPSY